LLPYNYVNKNNKSILFFSIKQYVHLNAEMEVNVLILTRASVPLGMQEIFVMVVSSNIYQNFHCRTKKI